MPDHWNRLSWDSEFRDEMVLVVCSWDSGPFATYEKTTGRVEIDGPGGYGTNTVPISRSLYERYEHAVAELRAAAEALDEAENAYLTEARKRDPRWQAEAKR